MFFVTEKLGETQVTPWLHMSPLWFFPWLQLIKTYPNATPAQLPLQRIMGRSV